MYRSSSRSSRSFSARTSRVFLPSQPCTVFASAHFALPATVLGPVERPPCARQTALPFIGALRHCSPERLERAWQRDAMIRGKRDISDIYLTVGDDSMDDCSQYLRKGMGMFALVGRALSLFLLAVSVVPAHAGVSSFSLAQPAVEQLEHSGGCRKDSPYGMCCHAGSQPYHCH